MKTTTIPVYAWTNTSTDPPEITQISGDTMINLASNVTLVCIARSNPSPIIRWHKEEDGDDENNLYEDLGYVNRNELYLG